MLARTITVGLALAILGTTTLAPAARGAAVDPELRRIYRQILNNPTDTKLNLAYARLAERKRLHRKALAAYERILLIDPNNAEARAGLRRIKAQLEPDFTTVYLHLGARYATNVRLRTDRFNQDKGAPIGDGRLVLRDERRWGSRRWRTLGQAYGNLHGGGARNLDFGFIGANTGPLINLPGEWRFRPALGAAFSWLDRRVLFTELSVLLNFEAQNAGAFQRLDIRLSYDFIGSTFSDRDGFVIDVAPRFVFPNIARQGDAVTLRPRYFFNGATGREPNDMLVQGDLFPERYHQAGIEASYFAPILNGRVIIGPTIEANVRFYRSNKPSSGKRRRDLYIRPGAQLIVPNAFRKGHTLVFRYQFENNVSNDGLRNFRNHVFGVRSVWRLY